MLRLSVCLILGILFSVASPDASAMLRVYLCWKYPDGTIRNCTLIRVISPGTGALEVGVYDLVGGGGGGGGGGEGQEATENRCEQANEEKLGVTTRPVVIASGEKILPEADFIVGNSMPLGIGRTYQSMSPVGGAFGAQWSSSIDYGLTFHHGPAVCASALHQTTTCNTSVAGLTGMEVRRPGGGNVPLTYNGSSWEDESGDYTLVWDTQNNFWQVQGPNGELENYGTDGRPTLVRSDSRQGWDFQYTAGKLSRVVHTDGQQMDIAWSGSKVSTVTAPGSKVYAYGYNASGYLSSVTFPDGLGQRTYHYEVASNSALLTGFSVNGVRTTRYAYHNDGRVAESGLEGGFDKSTFTYAISQTRVTNAAGHVVTYFLDDDGRMDRISRPASLACPGGSLVTDFNAEGRVESETDAAGNISRFWYTANGRLRKKSVGETATSTAGQRITVYDWDSTGKKIVKKWEYGATEDAAGLVRTTTYAYYPKTDPSDLRNGLLSSVTIVDEADAAKPSRISSYDYIFHPNKQVAQVRENGPLPSAVDLTTYYYTSEGFLTKIMRPTGLTTMFEDFTPLGKARKVTDPNGLVLRYTFDARERMLSQTIEAPTGNRATTFTYDGLGNISTVTDSSGRVTTYIYDGVGRLLEKRVPAAHPQTGLQRQNFVDTETYSYNNLNQMVERATQQVWLKRVISGYDGMGEPVYSWVEESRDFSSRHWNYDAAGYLSSIQGNYGQEMSFDYDGNGDPTAMAEGTNASITTYDSQRRVRSVVAPGGGTAWYEYDALGRLKKFTDAKGHVTQYVRNGFGDVVQRISQDSGSTSYTYDMAGRLLTRSTADGSVVTITRDALGRTLTESATWPTYTLGSPPAEVHVYTYDCATGKGRLCSVSDASGTTTYTYLSSGELATQASVISGVTYQLAFTYDLHGRLATATYPGNRVLSYSYTLNHQIKSIQIQINGGALTNVLTSAAYQPFGGQLVGFTHGNGLARQLDYDLDGRITRVYGAGTYPQDLTYSYNVFNRVSGITNSKNAATSETFTYDAAGKLAVASSTYTGTQSWLYDNNGNRSNHTWGGTSDTYAMTTLGNRLAAVSGPRARTFTYDAAGNVRTELRGSTTAERRYNGYGRPVTFSRPATQVVSKPGGGSATLPAGTWTYAYNGLGQRVSKTNGAGQATRYLYSPGGVLLGETSPGSSTLDTIYIWLHGQVVAVERAGALYAVHADAMGRPELVTNAAKAIVWRANNFAFDRHVTSDSFGGLSLGYLGQQYDAETGAWYNMAREYDAGSGRYLQADPTGLDGGTNLYSYAHSNPITFSDPFGRKEGDCYASPEDAAAAALSELIGESMTLDREYAGAIYQNPNGTFSYQHSSLNHTSTPAWSTPGPIDANRIWVGIYHTHGADTPDQDDEIFSDGPNQDIENAYWMGRGARMGPHPSDQFHSFLGTPNLQMFGLDPMTGVVTPYGNIADNVGSTCDCGD